jgi:hypothetical protein
MLPFSISPVRILGPCKSSRIPGSTPDRGYRADAADVFRMLLVAAVGKVEAEDADPPREQGPDGCLVAADRT